MKNPHLDLPKSELKKCHSCKQECAMNKISRCERCGSVRFKDCINRIRSKFHTYFFALCELCAASRVYVLNQN